jgi:alpha-mannosidase
MSTPKRYVDALKKENTAWPVYLGDFFRYFEKPGDGYWTGFYTSRPAFKK